MLKSMTAYARKESRNEWGTVTWELRSVNHRYLEPLFKLPDNFRDVEPELRNCLHAHLSRGKLECHLRVQLEAQSGPGMKVNMEVAETLNNVLHQINRMLDNPAHINALDILKWPGVLEVEELDLEPIKEEVLAVFDEALTDLVETRDKEGARIRPMLEERLIAIQGIVDRVRDRLPHIIERQNEALRARFEDLDLDLDDGRIEQELVVLAQKADVAEELDRLETHSKEVLDVLDRKEPVGRRLDFLMQELNREANTLGSKSLVTETSQLAVDLKVIIEQMREQIQNIE
ncbi:MAG: YicC family protein [Hahellaceae bacterium]|nr:YicC family protein [Hahellaceae bacterium]